MGSFRLCVVDGWKKMNHLVQKREDCDYEHAYRWIMECGVSVIAAEPMDARPDFPVCERCLKTKRGEKYLLRQRRRERSGEQE